MIVSITDEGSRFQSDMVLGKKHFDDTNEDYNEEEEDKLYYQYNSKICHLCTRLSYFVRQL